MNRRLRWALGAVAALAVLVVAGHGVWRASHATHLADLADALRTMPTSALSVSALWTLGSFLALGALEALACRMLPRHTVPPGAAMGHGAIAHALCNTLGFHAVLAPALRLVLYRPYAWGATDVARLLGVVAVGIAVGVAGVAAIAFAASARDAVPWLPMLIAAGLVGAALACIRRGTGTTLRLGAPIALVAIAECGCAIAALYVLLPQEATAAWPLFALAFLGASVAGVVAHVPGGLGVFEGMLLAALPGDRTAVLAALLAYRLVYNLLPAAIAGVALALLLISRGRGVSSTVDTHGSHVAGRGTAARVRTGGSGDGPAGGWHR
ncbi:hypothetical protein [Lysobacter xanthus]